MEKSLKIFFAIAPGIAIGLYAAYQFGAHVWWLWILGAFVGACLSYLLFEFKAVIRAASVAWNRATEWKPDKDAWRMLFLATLGFLSVALTCVIVALIAELAYATIEGVSFWDAFSIDFKSTHSPNAWVISTIIFILSGSVLGVFAILWSIIPLGAFVMLRSDRYNEDREWFTNMKGTARWFIKFANPVAVFFYCPAKGALYLAIKGALHLPILVCDICRFSKRFFLNFFLIIHSQDRSLCFTVTFLGVVIGYIAQANILASAIVGGIAGVIYAHSRARAWVVNRLSLQNGFAD